MAFSYTKCDFATDKMEKEIRSITNLQTNNTKLSVWLTIPAFTSNKATTKQKITDWITSQKPISWRHPITLNNNITDIPQKKICLKALTIQLSIAYLCDTHNNERLKLPQNATPFYTRCTQSFWMTSKRHPIKPIMFSLREETQCFRI